MQHKPAPPASFDPTVLSMLACPACHGHLRTDNAHLVCADCRRAYPIVDDIPVLIVDRAKALAK